MFRAAESLVEFRHEIEIRPSDWGIRVLKSLISPIEHNVSRVEHDDAGLQPVQHSLVVSNQKTRSIKA